MYLWLLYVMTLLSSCGAARHIPVKEFYGDHDALRKAYEEKAQEAQEKFDRETGWPSAEDCDGLLWAGIARAAGINSVLFNRAEQASGRLSRRPKAPCFADGKDLGSDSTISKDMVLGYLYASWRSGDLGAMQRLAAYGESHYWVLGEPFPARADKVLLTGNQIGLLGRIIENLSGGQVLKPYRNIEPIYSMVKKDYEQHLMALFILLNGEVRGWISSYEKHFLKYLRNSDRANPLFAAAYALYDDGDFNSVISGLGSATYTPSYARGSDNYKLVAWLFTADLILRNFPESQYTENFRFCDCTATRCL